MLFEKRDIECMKLLSLCRYVSVKAPRTFEHPGISKTVIEKLTMHRLVKYTRNRQCVKLTGLGKVLLSGIGYDYPDDARPQSKGNEYRRRVIASNFNILLHKAGIDIFAKTLEDLNNNNNIYLSGLLLRSLKTDKSASGTQFLGILKSAGDIYIPYYFENGLSGIHTTHEETTFTGLMTTLKDSRNIKLIFTGRKLIDLWLNIFENSAPKLSRGLLNCRQVYAKLVYEVCLLELSNDGVLQINLMSMPNYRARIAESFCGNSNLSVPDNLSFCDGIKNGNPLIVAVDMELKRINSALEQAKLYGKPPHIVCIPVQKEALIKMMDYNGIEKVKFLVLRKNKISLIFEEFDKGSEALAPYITKEGGYIAVP